MLLTGAVPGPVPVPSAPSADSGYWVISGQHISKAVQAVAAELLAEKGAAPPQYEVVTATVLRRGPCLGRSVATTRSCALC